MTAVDIAAAAAPQRRADGRPAGNPRKEPRHLADLYLGAVLGRRCAILRWGWPRTAFAAATSWRSSATTGRGLYWAQLAAQCLGGTAVPMYQDSIASELVFVLNHAEVSVVVAEDQEQVDKILSLRAELPHLELVVYDDPRGLRHYSDGGLESFAEMQAAGREFGAANPGYVEAEIDSGDPDDLALLTYTSGTTGRPKGVMLSHANLLSSAQGFIAAEDIRATDELLCYLPMAWIGNSLFSLVLTLLVGFTCNCPERPQTVQRDLRELGPTIAHRAAADLGEHADPAAGQGGGFDAAEAPAVRVLSRSRRASGGAQGRRQETVAAGAARPGARRGVVYGPVRDQLGLRRARWVYTGGAPLGPDTFRFFRAVRDQHQAGMGLDRARRPCLVAAGRPGDPDTVGRVIPGTELRIAEDGEVLIRSAAVFKGYYKQPDATRETMTEDGWFRTGNSGFVDRRGHLVIVDRAKDVGELMVVDGVVGQVLGGVHRERCLPVGGEDVGGGRDQPLVLAVDAVGGVISVD